MHPARCADVGIFSLGNPTIDLLALRYIKQRYNNRNDDVVISGAGLAVFHAAGRLLKVGVSPMRITLVVREEEGNIEGFTEKNVCISCCDDKDVFKTYFFFVLFRFWILF
jgi:hypothetical protein